MTQIEPQNMNYIYRVEYEEEGERYVEDQEAGNAGTAFALCLKAHPGATLLKATVSGKWADGYGEIVHTPPKVQRPPAPRWKPARPLNKKERGCEFPWYDEVKNTGLTSRKSE